MFCNKMGKNNMFFQRGSLKVFRILFVLQFFSFVPASNAEENAWVSTCFEDEGCLLQVAANRRVDGDRADRIFITLKIDKTLSDFESVRLAFPFGIDTTKGVELRFVTYKDEVSEKVEMPINGCSKTLGCETGEIDLSKKSVGFSVLDAISGSKNVFVGYWMNGKPLSFPVDLAGLEKELAKIKGIRISTGRLEEPDKIVSVKSGIRISKDGELFVNGALIEGFPSADILDKAVGDKHIFHWERGSRGDVDYFYVFPKHGFYFSVVDAENSRASMFRLYVCFSVCSKVETVSAFSGDFELAGIKITADTDMQEVVKMLKLSKDILGFGYLGDIGEHSIQVGLDDDTSRLSHINYFIDEN